MKLVAMFCTALLLATGNLASADDANVGDALKFKVKSIDGKDVDLAKYKDKVVLIVNLASQ